MTMSDEFCREQGRQRGLEQAIAELQRLGDREAADVIYGLLRSTQEANGYGRLV